MCYWTCQTRNSPSVVRGWAFPEKSDQFHICMIKRFAFLWLGNKEKVHHLTEPYFGYGRAIWCQGGRSASAREAESSQKKKLELK